MKELGSSLDYVCTSGAREVGSEERRRPNRVDGRREKERVEKDGQERGRERGSHKGVDMKG